MAKIFADRVLETTTVTGTGPATLLGAIDGFQRFDGPLTVADTCDYAIYGVDGDGLPTGEWETGLGTYSGTDTLTRTTPKDGSAGVDTAVTFSAGTKYVMMGFNAASLVALLAAAAAPTECIIVALGDETTAITTGTAKVTMRMPYAFTLTAVRASLTTVSSSGIPTVDINEGGSSILSTKLTIDASEKTSTTAATAAVISDANLADDAEITFDIDVAGTGAAGLKVYLIGHR